jgi:hypothetical protein
LTNYKETKGAKVFSVHLRFLCYFMVDFGGQNGHSGNKRKNQNGQYGRSRHSDNRRAVLCRDGFQPNVVEICDLRRNSLHDYSPGGQAADDIGRVKWGIEPIAAELANLFTMVHYSYGYSFSRASTVMRHQPLKYSGGVMDSSRAG